MEPDKVHRGEEKIEITERPYISYNPYFIIPFLIWVVIGGIALLFHDRQVLFAMVNTRHTETVDILMVLCTRMGEGIVSVVLLSALLFIPSLRNKWYVIAALLTNALPALLTQVIKSSINAPRPLTVFKGAQWVHTLPEWPRLMERSFPSGHTCAAFCLFCFLSFFLSYGHRAWAILFFLLALLVGYSRLYLAAHFFHDIYAGSILGTTFTIGMMFLLEHYRGYFFRYVRPGHRTTS